MKASNRVLAVITLAYATQANASQYAWCEVSAGERYASGIIEIEEGTDAFHAFDSGPFGPQFREYIEATVQPNTDRADCFAQNNLYEAQKFMEADASAFPSQFHYTRWTGDRPEAVDGGESKSRPTEGVIIAAPGSAPKAAPTPKNSRAASENRAKDEAEFARKQAEYEAALAENKRLHEEYLQQLEQQKGKSAELAARAAAEKVKWEARVAACKGGDITQCGTPGSPQ